MSIDPTLDKIQTVFKYTEQYFLWHLDSFTPNQHRQIFAGPSISSWDHHTQIAMKARSFSDLIGQGLDHLIEGRTVNGWKSIRACCRMLKSVLWDQHRGLLRFICAKFSDFRWQKLPGLRPSLLRHFADMAVAVLGEMQPLSIILRHFNDPSIFEGSSELILKVILDTCGRRLNKLETGDLEREHCNILRHLRNYRGAENACLSLVSRCEVTYGYNNAETRRALRRLAHVYMDQRQEQKAEQIYADILARGAQQRQENAGFPLDDSVIFTYHDLVRLSTYRGDLMRAERYWKIAYDGAVNLFGAPNGTSCYCRKHHNTLDALKIALNGANGDPTVTTKAEEMGASRFFPYPWRTVEKVVCVGQECCAQKYGLIHSSWPM